MVSTPKRMATLGDVISTPFPSRRISPLSGCRTPESILISVDFPAPLSPTSPTTSRDCTSSVTPFSAWTPSYHLWMCRTEISGDVMSGRHLYPPRRSTQPRVGDHSEDCQGADSEFEPVGVDLGHYESVVDDPDQQGADNGAEHGADAAAQRGSPDHRGGDRLELESVPDRGQR